MTQILVAGANTFQEFSTLSNRNFKDLRENDYFSVWVTFHQNVATLYADVISKARNVFMINTLTIDPKSKKTRTHAIHDVPIEIIKGSPV